MKNQEKEAIHILEKYNQHHIVEHINKLNEKDKKSIINQIREEDLAEIINLYEKTKTERTKRNIKIEPLQTIIAKQMDEKQKNEYIKKGEEVLKNNKYAVITLAGGQGTRLRA